jgi:Cu+-exporting ATPase
VVGNANRLRRYHPAPLPEAKVAGVTPRVEAGSGHSHDTAVPASAPPSHGAQAHDGAGYAHGTPAYAGGGHIHAGTGNDGPAAGATATDPVCGMQVDSTSTAHRDTGTGTMYFCSTGCAAAFDAQPQRYPSPAAGAAPGDGSR